MTGNGTWCVYISGEPHAHEREYLRLRRTYCSCVIPVVNVFPDDQLFTSHMTWDATHLSSRVDRRMITFRCADSKGIALSKVKECDAKMMNEFTELGSKLIEERIALHGKTKHTCFRVLFHCPAWKYTKYTMSSDV